jgi:hypothetical protein
MPAMNVYIHMGIARVGEQRSVGSKMNILKGGKKIDIVHSKNFK